MLWQLWTTATSLNAVTQPEDHEFKPILKTKKTNRMTPEPRITRSGCLLTPAQVEAQVLTRRANPVPLPTWPEKLRLTEQTLDEHTSQYSDVPLSRGLYAKCNDENEKDKFRTEFAKLYTEPN